MALVRAFAPGLADGVRKADAESSERQCAGWPHAGYTQGVSDPEDASLQLN